MDNCRNPDFAINIKRRAIFRMGFILVLLFLFLGVLYQYFGATLTVTVPKDVTSVRLQKHGGRMDVTLTQREQIATVTDYLATIGTVRQAHVDEKVWNSGPLETITLYTAEGTQVVYSFHNTGVVSQGSEPLTQIRSKNWFWFNDHSALAALFEQFAPQ